MALHATTENVNVSFFLTVSLSTAGPLLPARQDLWDKWDDGIMDHCVPSVTVSSTADSRFVSRANGCTCILQLFILELFQTF
ncbi:hypothetical protein F4680DRAFT_414356 [Xylaria scruposa]|nr:hypothetical protein F4680DRAFT_414356 [Xylaria scruposa]